MPDVQVKHARSIRDALVKQLLQQQTVKARQVAEDTARRAKFDLDKTLEHSGESDEDGFQGANVRSKIERIARSNKGVEMTIRIWMADGQGDPHPVWHILQFGRRPFRQKRTSPAIQERVQTPRTQPRNLAAGVFQGYTGDTFRIRAGTEIPALPAREWYEQVGENRREEVPARWEGWQVSEVETHKP